jgi:glycosyltransferase involved in cell wall biosynthesis
MKILQSCGSRSWGGLEMYTLRTAEKLKEHGHDVSLLCRKNSTLSRKAENSGVPVHPYLNSDIMLPKAVCKLTGLLNPEKYDIIHTHLSHDLWIIVPAKSLSNAKSKLFLTKHMGSGVDKKDLFHRYLYNNVDGIFSISNYVKESVISTCPVNPGKVHVLHPGISLEKYNKSLFDRDDVKRTYSIPPGYLLAGIAGRMTPGKGYEEFLRAVGSLKNKMSIKIKYLLIGSASYSEEDYEKHLRTLAHELDIESDVIFTGFIDNIPEIFSVLDIFVFPSHEESFGFMLLEAMAMELPVIASNNAGIPDIVIPDETGILIPPKDISALADSVQFLSQDKGLRNKLGKAGRRRIEMYFRFDDIINTLENYYSK